MHGYEDAGLRRLDEPAGTGQASDSAAMRHAVERRDTGRRQTRRISGWAAAGLVAGVAAGAGYFAHAVPPAAVSTSSTAVQGTPGTAGQKPTLTHPVVTSGGSGVVAGTSGGSATSTGGSPASGSTVQWQDN